MIHKISIENFFSIAERQVVNFEVAKHAPLVPSLRPSRSDPNLRLPVVIGFFGPNASGKSTMLRAAVSSVRFATSSFNLAPEQLSRLFQPYRTHKWWDQPTKITIDFDSQLNDDTPSEIFRYELHVAHEALNLWNKTVAYEALSFSPKGKFRKLFERHGQRFRFGDEFGLSNSDPRKESIRPNASVLSTLAQLNHALSITLIGYANSLQTNILGLDRIQVAAQHWLPYYSQNPKALERLNHELQRLDVGLDKMTVDQGPSGLFAKFEHIGLDEAIFLEEESQGTRRFIEIFPQLHLALETGTVAIIDEFDADLHPLLIPELFRWFASSERNTLGAQLLFAAHNATLLNDLEKEQVFLIEKPSGEATLIYGASDIKGLRRDPSLMKKYLSGELGAVPHIG